MHRDMILHIGTSKTGSTSIQKVLSGHRADLLKQGRFYPRSPGNERHEYLAVAASTNKRHLRPASKPLWQGTSAAERMARFATEFAAEMSSIPASATRIILSAEQFSMYLLNKESVQNLFDLLSPYADKITVVVYLRRQDQHLVSLYSEMLRWGDVLQPDLLNLKTYPAHDYSYDVLLDRWAAVFGEDACKPRIFQKSGNRQFDVVEDFLSLCGLTIDLDQHAHARTANPSINQSGQMLLLALADHLRSSENANVQSPQWQSLTMAASKALPGRGWLPTRDEARAFMQRYAESNEAVRKRWFANRKTLFSTDFSDLPESSTAPENTELISAAVRMMLELANMTARQQPTETARRAASASNAGPRKGPVAAAR